MIGGGLGALPSLSKHTLKFKQMTKTYITSAGEIIINEIPDMHHFSTMTDEAKNHTMLIDNLVVNQLVRQGDWKLKEN